CRARLLASAKYLLSLRFFSRARLHAQYIICRNTKCRSRCRRPGSRAATEGRRPAVRLSRFSKTQTPGLDRSHRSLSKKHLALLAGSVLDRLGGAGFGARLLLGARTSQAARLVDSEAERSAGSLARMAACARTSPPVARRCRSFGAGRPFPRSSTSFASAQHSRHRRSETATRAARAHHARNRQAETGAAICARLFWRHRADGRAQPVRRTRCYATGIH